jgi:hypothetical protein
MPPCASLCALVIRATRTPNGSDLRSIGRRSEAQGVNVLRRETKVRKLFIIERSEPRPDTLLPGIVVSLNKSTHQARSGFQVLGRACGHASPQKLKVHDRLLFSCKKRLRPALGPEARRRGPVAPLAGMGAHCTSASAIRCVAQCGLTFVVAQGALCHARRACTFERSCAVAFNLAENSVTLDGDRPWLLRPMPECRERV